MFNNFPRETAAALIGFWSHLSVWCQTCAHNALWEISLKTSSSHFGSKNRPKLGTKTASRSFGCYCTMGDFFKNELKSLWVQKSNKLWVKNSVALIWLLLQCNELFISLPNYYTNIHCYCNT